MDKSTQSSVDGVELAQGGGFRMTLTLPKDNKDKLSNDESSQPSPMTGSAERSRLLKNSNEITISPKQTGRRSLFQSPHLALTGLGGMEDEDANMFSEENITWSGPNISRYDSETLLQYGFLFYLKGTTLCSPNLAKQIILYCGIATFCAFNMCEEYCDLIHSPDNTGCVMKEFGGASGRCMQSNSITFAMGTMLKNLVGFLIGLYTVETFRRWWDLRKKLQAVMGNAQNICMVTQAYFKRYPPDTAENRQKNREIRVLSGKLRGYACAINRMLYILANDEDNCQLDRSLFHSEGKDDFEEIEKIGLLTRAELEMVRKRGKTSYVLVFHWMTTLITRAAYEDMIHFPERISELLFDQLENMKKASHGIFMYLDSQLPYAYAHLMSFLTNVHLFLWSLAVASWIGKGLFIYNRCTRGALWSQHMSYNDDDDRCEGPDEEFCYPCRWPTWPGIMQAGIAYTMLILCNIIYSGLFEIQDVLANPLGKDASDFATELYRKGMENNTDMLLKQDKTLLPFATLFPTICADLIGLKTPRHKSASAGFEEDSKDS